MSQTKLLRSSLLFIAVLPTIKSELALTYTQVGLLFTLPGLLSIGGEPFIGLLGDTRHRRALVLGGSADAFGLQTAMRLLIVGPIALIWGVR